jgi:hypothetical protein
VLCSAFNAGPDGQMPPEIEKLDAKIVELVRADLGAGLQSYVANCLVLRS